MKDKLLKKLPKKYHERVADFYADGNLTTDIDENGNEYRYKYMLSFMDGFAWDGFESLPCRSITEAVDFVRNSEVR